MPTCPFCQSTIPEELDRFGGSCPHCFNEVPGEEAATDPGIAEAAPGAAAPAAQKGSGLGPMLLVVVLLIGGGAWYAMGPGAAVPAAPVAAEDDPDFYSIDLDELETTSVIPTVAGREQAAKDAAKAASSGGSRTSTTRKTTTSTSGSSGGTPQSAGAPPASTSGPSEPAADSSKPVTTAEKASGTSGASAGAGVSVRRRQGTGVALSDPAEIAAMVREAMSRYSDQFAQCHTKKLNQNEDFGGTWELSLVVNTDGSASRIAVQAKDGTPADAEFESCMVAKVEKWRFKTTTEAIGFKKRYTFGG